MPGRMQTTTFKRSRMSGSESLFERMIQVLGEKTKETFTSGSTVSP
ncbi:hypothetical protein LSS_17435 [Leptospira santarosai serovar Shermani str. LT 821]|uniref:Uncharacterized protein n=1 Tax=Leptospira santarosai serovar Shermani str. LT 821 TaxID=758847 RepID=K8Y6T2_9LEPT|nr:hypothetical protein LSS_17435 [Leptospira santarosai serovar Shermani str. LT 821]